MEISNAQSWDGLGLDAFVPVLLRRRIAERPGLPVQPRTERLSAAVLVADLTGFTSLAETFARRGPRGAEDLRDVLNFFCGHLADLVESHGGEVFRFAGDAALALWADGDGCLDNAVHCAALCSIAAQQRFRDVEAPHHVRLQLRIGLGAGEVWLATVGGVSGRWEFVMGGDPLSQAVAALSAAGPGETTASTIAWNTLPPHARGSDVTGRSVRVDAVPALVPPPSAAPAAYPALADSLLRAFVPLSVQARLDASQTNWLAEFRHVTVMLINLKPAVDTAAFDLDHLQCATVAVQAAVSRYGGSINQLLVDDKGTVALCGWGLALHAHGDDQVRAVRAALEIRHDLRDAGCRAALGLATGEVFAGLVGTTRRCEYALIGDVVNVAARLMEAAGDDVLCDASTRELVNRRVAFDVLPPLRAKGRERPVDVFRPTHVSASGTEVLGRAQERLQLRDRLNTAAGGVGGVVLLTGDPGIGKSRLVAEVAERAIAKGIRIFVAAADSIERSAPYHVWCQVFDSLLGLDTSSERVDAQRRLREVLESNAALMPFAPLLNSVLGLNFPETEQTEHAPPRGRAALTRDLLLHVFRETIGSRPTLLVLEDAHWLDSSSWELAEGIASQLPHVLLLMALRPGAEREPVELQRLRALEGTLVMHLDVLGLEDTCALVAQRLRAHSVSDEVARLIHVRTEGHPFFVEEFVHALRDRGLLSVEKGVACFSGPASAALSFELPSTIHILVNSRIDQLTVPHQLTAKVASVFGRTFDLEGLQTVYPIEVSPDELRRHLEALVGRDLVRRSPSERTSGYEFKHAITQEVAYSLLPFALRRQLHAACAQWYEARHGDHLASLYPLLAHHWSRADVADRALFYLERSGEQAASRHASEEASRFFAEALDIDERSNQSGTEPGPAAAAPGHVSNVDLRRIRWLRYVGDAAINLGRWDEGRRHFERALALTGFPLPTTRGGWIRGLLTRLLVQAMHRLTPRGLHRAPADTEALLSEVIRVYARVGANAYFYERMDQMFYSLVSALNVGERLGPSPELALAYADIGNIFGLAPLRPVARLYHRLAVQTANGLQGPLARARIPGRAAVYHLAVGNWDACADIRAAMAVCDEFGDSYAWEENAAFLARAAHLQGDFSLATELGATIRGRAALSGSSAHEVWGFAAETWGLVHQGQLTSALELADRGLRLATAAVRSDRLATLDLLGGKTLAHLYRLEWPQARTSVDQIVDILKKSARPRYFSTLYLSAATEACLAFLEMEQPLTHHSEMDARVSYLCRQLELYARINPPATARALLWRGCAQWQREDRTRAAASWHHALAAAERFKLSYETARVHYEVGRRLAPADPARQTHLARAEDGFRSLGAHADLKRVTSARDTGAQRAVWI